MVIVTGHEFLSNPWYLRFTYSNPWKFARQNMWYLFEMCDTRVMCVNISPFLLIHF